MLEKLQSTGKVPRLQWRPRTGPFCAGLGIGLLGACSLAWGLLSTNGPSERVALAWLGAGTLFVLAGAAVVYVSYIEVCGACRVSLASTYATLPLELHTRVRTAVQAAGLGDLDPILLLEGAPLAPRHALRTASLELVFCPTCRHIGRLSSAERRHRHKASTAAHDGTSSVVLSGRALGLALEVIAARNMARTRASYAG